MRPDEIGKAYDQITERWAEGTFNYQNGIEAHKKALQFVKDGKQALDVGCGRTGRFIDLFFQAGMDVEGVDVSQKMIQLAKQKHPDVTFYHADICQWVLPKSYDLISAWDSIWHVPLEEQARLIRKLLEHLTPSGVLIFSFGGTDKPGQHTNSVMGPEVYYSTLGVSKFLDIIIQCDCVCRHLEYDQYPELHTYMVVQKL